MTGGYTIGYVLQQKHLCKRVVFENARIFTFVIMTRFRVNEVGGVCMYVCQGYLDNRDAKHAMICFFLKTRVGLSHCASARD